MLPQRCYAIRVLGAPGEFPDVHPRGEAAQGGGESSAGDALQHSPDQTQDLLAPRLHALRGQDGLRHRGGVEAAGQRRERIRGVPPGGPQTVIKAE